MRKTKIICTLGPATDNENVLREIIQAGMNVARINFSHQTHKDQLERVAQLKMLREELKLPVALLADTKGPEIRTGSFSTPTITLEDGQSFTLTTRNIVGDNTISKVSFEGLPNDVSRGTHVMIADGLIDLIVESVSGTEVVCTVVDGGEISAHKGINIPGAKISIPFINSRDRADLRFAVENGFDFVAASFARTAADILLIREELERLGDKKMRIIAKIENIEGVSNIDSILQVCDGVMVARGDLGVEIPLEDVPIIQKMLIKKAYQAGKQVITATQMLESMMKNSRPTRAEATDIANAIYDGTSAIMLSGETAAGNHPIEAVKTMARIAERTEKDIDYKKRFRSRSYDNLCNVTEAISHATCAASHDLNASAIITVTKSGGTARMISKYRPETSIIGCSTCETVVRQMNLSWGVSPVLVDEKNNTDDLFAHAVKKAQSAGLIKDGDLVVITAGVPLGISGTTNMLKVHVVGEKIN